MPFYELNRNRLAALDFPEKERVLAALDAADPPDVADTQCPGCPTLFAAAADGTGIALHSARDPVREARAWVARFDLAGARTAVLAGAGLGYAVEEILRAAPNLQILCVIEPDLRHLCAALHHRDLPWLAAPQLRLFAGPFPWAGPALQEFFDRPPEGGAPSDIPILVHAPSLRALPGSEKDFQDIFLYIRNIRRPAQIFMQQLAETNAQINAGAVAAARSVSVLSNTLPEAPAVIVAPGPSLQKNIALMPLLARHAALICLDAALKPLLDAGVVPDFVVTLDPQPAVARYLVGAPPPTRLVFFPGSPPDVVARYPADRRFVAQPADRIDAHADSLFASGSVFQPALDLCRLMGCNPIVFTGLDFAYGYGRSHVRGSLARGRDTLTDRDCDGYFGVPVRTVEAFYIYLRQTGAFIAQALRGRTVWDCTEGGALIDNTERLCLEHALFQLAGRTDPSLLIP